jgi:hypothetical protein
MTVIVVVYDDDDDDDEEIKLCQGRSLKYDDSVSIFGRCCEEKLQNLQHYLATIQSAPSQQP